MRKVTVLTDTVNGRTLIRYADAVVVGAKTARCISAMHPPASHREDWGGTFEASLLDILEQASTGRILEYDPATKATRLVASGLSFANGVALSGDEQSLFVNETGKYRVWKIAVERQPARCAHARHQAHAQAQVLLDNLPGYPDNLMRGLDGKIWLGFAKPRNPTVDNMAGKPWLRSLTLRLPRVLWPIPKAYGHVIAFTEDGKVVADLQDPSGSYPETTCDYRNQRPLVRAEPARPRSGLVAQVRRIYCTSPAATAGGSRLAVTALPAAAPMMNTIAHHCGAELFIQHHQAQQGCHRRLHAGHDAEGLLRQALEGHHLQRDEVWHWKSPPPPARSIKRVDPAEPHPHARCRRALR